MGNGSQGKKIHNEFRRPSHWKIALQKKEVLQRLGRNIKIRLTKTNCRSNKPDDYFYEIPSGNDQGQNRLKYP